MPTPLPANPRRLDCNCQFGIWPRSGLDASLPTVLGLSRAAGIDGVLIGSLRAALYDHPGGNQETLQVCAEEPDLIPAAGLCLRRCLRGEEEVRRIAGQGFRLLRLAREYEGFPLDYAPFWQVLTAAAEVGLPLMLAALQPGDITLLGRLLTRRPCPVIVTGVNVSHTPLLTEAIVVGRDVPTMRFETSRLEGTDTVDLMAREIGVERLVFGTALPFQYPSSAIALIEASALSAADQAAIFAGNLERLLARSQ